MQLNAHQDRVTRQVERPEATPHSPADTTDLGHLWMDLGGSD